MTDEDAAILASLAASAWGGTQAPPRLLRNRENAVFSVRLADGTQAALRLHRSGYQSADAIQGEMIWTDALARKGFPCPRPIPTTKGNLLYVTATGRYASAVTWIEAAPIGENGLPFAGSFAQQKRIYSDLGHLIARLHTMTDSLTLPDLNRSDWGAEGLLGDQPFWGRFWDNPALTCDESLFLQKARDTARRHLGTLEAPDIGPVHADLLQENILTDGTQLHMIDFDDSGIGYRAYDLGTALIQHAEHPQLDALSQALIAGYCDQRGDHAAMTETLPLFIMLRAMASAGWTIARLHPGAAQHRFYANRALQCAKRYLAAR